LKLVDWVEINFQSDPDEEGVEDGLSNLPSNILESVTAPKIPL
jgi:hypothetical protein